MKNIQVSIFALIFCISSILIFSGCEKENKGTDLAKGVFIVPGSQADFIDFKVSDRDTIIRFATSIFQPAAGNATVKLTIDNSMVSSFNAAYKTTHIALPAGSVVLKADNVTIADGQIVSSKDSLKFNHLLLNPSASYLLPLKIESVSGGGITLVPGMAFKYYVIKVKPPYEGLYASSGTRYNFNTVADAPANPASTSPWAFDANVVWVSGSTYKVHAANLTTFGNMNITVNTDNTVTVAATAETDAAGLVGLAPTPGKTSTYNPATKIFQLYYQYSTTAGAFRQLEHKLVFK